MDMYMYPHLAALHGMYPPNPLTGKLFSHFSQLLSSQPRVTVTSCIVYKIIRDLKSIDHLCINPILWIGLIHK